MEEFVRNLPKAELHVHLEGTFEADLWEKIAIRNGMDFPFKNVEEAKNAFEFKGLVPFLHLCDSAIEVLKNADDLYDLTIDYLNKCHEQNIRHVELTWGPTNFTEREANPISMKTQMEGIMRAVEEAKEKYNMTVLLILCFIRQCPVEQAYRIMEEAIPFKHQIKAVGLAGCEEGFGPELFEDVYKVAKEKYGYKLTAHAGEVTDAECIKSTIESLKVDRLDHGIKVMNDPKLLQEIIDSKIHLTLCPDSNLKLKVCSEIDDLPLRKFYDRGVNFSINSDDPPFFNASCIENYYSLVNAKTFNFTKEEWINIAKMSFAGSFLDEAQKQIYYTELDEYAAKHIV